MLEAGRRFWGRLRKANEQPVNPHGSIVSEEISGLIDSFRIEGYSSDLSSLIIHLGRERIGRKVVSFVSADDGKKHPYFVYYFDVLDPLNPQVRIGIKADQKKLQTYRVLAMEGFDRFRDTDEIDAREIVSMLKQTSHRINSFHKPVKVEQDSG